MTQTLTTELQQFEEWFVEKYKQPERLMKSSDGKYKFSGVQMAFDAWHDSRELLANREAQPVAWRHDNGPFAGMALTRSKSVADSWTANGWTVTPLYTAPPAPAVVELPAEFSSSEGVMVQLEKVMASLAVVGVEYERKGSACRAAILGYKS